MTPETFTALVETDINKILTLVKVKGEEYSRNGDRLSNFKQAAGLRLGETPEGALLGMLLKHWVSIGDFISDIAKGKVAPIEKWDEKILDNIVYSFLLKGLVVERLGIKINTGELKDDSIIDLSSSEISALTEDVIYKVKKSLTKIHLIADEHNSENSADWLSVRNEATESLDAMGENTKGSV